MTKAERFNRLIHVENEAAGLRTRSVRGGVFNAAAEAADFILRVGSIAILARLLVPEHFGLIGMVTAITAIAERFKDLGLSVVTVQRETISHEQVSALFWVNAALGVAAGLIVAALAVPIAAFYGDQRLVWITLAIALTFVWGGLAIQHQAILRRSMKFGQIAAINISASLGSIVIAVVLAALDFGYWALVAREVARSVLITVGTWGCCSWIPSRPARHTGVRAMVGFGGSVTAVQLATHFSMNFGHILIGRMFGANLLGMYRQGVQLVLGPISQLVYPVYTVSEVSLSRLQSQAESYRRFYRKILMLLCSATMPIAAFVVVQAENIVLIMLGADWLDAAPFFRILAFAAFLTPANSTINVVMVTFGQARKYLWLGLSSCGALVVCSLVGVAWGAIGVAAAHIVTTYSLLLPRMYWAFRGTPVTMGTFFSAISRPCIASVVMAAALLLAARSTIVTGPFAELMLACGVGATVYAATWLAVPGGRAELRGLVASLRDSLNSGKAAQQPA